MIIIVNINCENIPPSSGAVSAEMTRWWHH